jgi:hypothetical protein
MSEREAPIFRPHGVSRRDLLASGASALGWTALAPAVPLAAETVVAAAQRRLAVGFIEGSERFDATISPSSRELDGATVVPASSLILGEQSWAGEMVRMRIHGLYPRLTMVDRDTVDTAYLRVRYWADEDPLHRRPLDFIAWGARRHPANQGQSVSFLLRLGLTGNVLDLAVELRTKSKAGSLGAVGPVAPSVLSTSFTVDADAGMARIGPGLYLIGLVPGTYDAAVKLPESRASVIQPELRALMVSFRPLPLQ